MLSWFDEFFFFFLEEKVEVEEEEEEEDEQSKDEPTFSVNPDTPVGHDYVRQVSFISVSYFWEKSGKSRWVSYCLQWFNEFFFQIPQVVMFYCDLCHKYLPKLNRGDPDELIDTHCVSTSHQDAYVKKQIEEQEALKALAEVIYLFLTFPACF